MKTNALILFLGLIYIGCSNSPEASEVTSAGENTGDTSDRNDAITVTDTSSAWGKSTSDHDSTEDQADDAVETEDTITVQTETETEIEGTAVELCLWECLPKSGAQSCSVLGAHWVRNWNYECEDSSEVCCQALGAPGGLSESCKEQPAFYCQKNCAKSFVKNKDFYCDDASKVCCEDPAGPVPGCINAGGSCVSELLPCPGGTSKKDLSCTFGFKCCLPPVCPWECKPDVGATSCTKKTVNPDFVRNYNHSCEDLDEVCCQPLDGSGGVDEPCTGDVRLACRDTCQGIEQRNSALYCKKANLQCCEDPRPMCLDIQGACNLTLVGCQDGWEKNDRGVCADEQRICCTKAGPWNTCADKGGTCVEIGQSCPLTPVPTLPDFTEFCGLDVEYCCMPVI